MRAQVCLPALIAIDAYGCPDVWLSSVLKAYNEPQSIGLVVHVFQSSATHACSAVWSPSRQKV